MAAQQAVLSGVHRGPTWKEFLVSPRSRKLFISLYLLESVTSSIHRPFALQDGLSSSAFWHANNHQARRSLEPTKYILLTKLNSYHRCKAICYFSLAVSDTGKNITSELWACLNLTATSQLMQMDICYNYPVSYWFEYLIRRRGVVIADCTCLRMRES